MARPSNAATRLAIKIHKHVLECLDADTYIAAFPIASMIEAEFPALDAAASVRAEAGTEGMEILRLVAKITLWRDYWPDSESDVISMSGVAATGLTPDHVRAARAIVAAAEQGRVVTPASLEELDAVLNRPGPDVVVNEDGSCSPFPQPPAPAEGGTDVAGLVREINDALGTPKYVDFESLARQCLGALTAQAAALAAKEAEIADLERRLKAHGATILQRDQVEGRLHEAGVNQRERIAALEAALRPFAEVPIESGGSGPFWVEKRNVERARAELAQKEG